MGVSTQQQGPLPYLSVAGLEVANGARTIEYLRNGLGNTGQGHWVLGDGQMCGVMYRDGSGCTPQTFVSPAADPAPWYDPDEPGSASFLGLMLTSIEGYDSTVTRPVVQRFSGLSGGSFGSEQRTPRTWKFQGTMISGDDTGAEYGLRWLTQVLKASECDSCSTSNLSVRLLCPEDDCSDDDLGLWTSYSTALTDGPHETGYFVSSFDGYLGACRDAVNVEFTIVAANPYLYQQPVWCLDATINADTCTNICDFIGTTFTTATACCDVSAPAQGVNGAIATFASTTSQDGGGVFISYVPGCGSNTATKVIALSSVPAGSTVTVNSAQHTVTIKQNGVVSDGTYLIASIDGEPIQWVEVADCDEDGCFCVGPACFGASTVAATVYIQNRQG